MNRTKNSIRNVFFTIVGSIILTLLQLINRRVFIEYLSDAYLGLNGLFYNIVTVLSMSEMGIGTALIFAMYKPVAEADREKIKSLMHLYKKLYTAIGLFVIGFGALLTPFLGSLIKEMPDISYIHLYYIMYVIDSGMSYFYTYKRSLIICNQEDYISSATVMITSVITKIMQFLVLVLTQNYFLYLLIQIIFTRLENVLISKIADKKFPYLLEKDVKPLDKEETGEIRKNILGMMTQKIGGVLASGTDNLIISKILGLTVLGFYSNYMLLISTMNSLIGKVFSSITASIGNLVAKKDREEVEKTFRNILFINYWIFSFVSVCFGCLLQPFISIWLGKKYLLSDVTVWVMVLLFYVNGMRKTVLIFRNATGMFWHDRYKTIVEAVINLLLSIPLTYLFGVMGVKLGSLLALIAVTFWIEGYVLYKKYFIKSPIQYYYLQLKYIVLTIAEFLIINKICGVIDHGTVVSFFYECVACVILTNAVLVLLFGRTKEFRYLCSILKCVGEKRRKE